MASMDNRRDRDRETPRHFLSCMFSSVREILKQLFSHLILFYFSICGNIYGINYEKLIFGVKRYYFENTFENFTLCG